MLQSIGDTTAWQALPVEKKERIFYAALGEFTKGYKSASMNKLALEAGVSKGSLFNYFRSKDHLFERLVITALGKVAEYRKGVREETRDLPFDQQLGARIRSGFRFIEEHPQMACIYFDLLQSGEAPSGARQALLFYRNSTNYFVGLIDEAKQRGELREDLNSGRVAFLINSMLENILRAYYTERLSIKMDLYRADKKTQEEWISLILDLIRGELYVKKEGS